MTMCNHGHSCWGNCEICNAGGFACTPIAILPPWILSAVSESGNKYAYRFHKEPSRKEIESFLREFHPDEFTPENDGPGDFGSYLHIELVKDD